MEILQSLSEFPAGCFRTRTYCWKCSWGLGGFCMSPVVAWVRACIYEPWGFSNTARNSRRFLRILWNSYEFLHTTKGSLRILMDSRNIHRSDDAIASVGIAIISLKNLKKKESRCSPGWKNLRASAREYRTMAIRSKPKPNQNQTKTKNMTLRMKH